MADLPAKGRTRQRPAKRWPRGWRGCRFSTTSSRIRRLKGRVDDVIVSTGGYVSRVTAMLSALEGRTSLVVNVDAGAVPIPAEDAAKLGLIASEAVANTFRHASRDHEDGLVEIRLKRLGDDRLRLSVADDGIGLGTERWPQEGKAGARIARSFAAQLGGQLDVSSGRFGTTVKLDLH